MRKLLASFLLVTTLAIVGFPAPLTAYAATTVSPAYHLAGRLYLLHVPRSYKPGRPLLVAFHGHGSSAAAFESLTGLSRLADRDGFLVVYPQGGVGPDQQTGWNTGRAGRDPSSDDVGYVGSLVTNLQHSYSPGSHHVYAVGFSNGGGLAAILACRDASQFAAFAAVAGDYVPPAGGCHPTQPVSLLEIHGTADTVNPYNGSTTLNEPSVSAWVGDWVGRDGCGGSPRITYPRRSVNRELWSHCSRGTSIEHERFAGVGHVWGQAFTGDVWSFFHGS